MLELPFPGPSLNRVNGAHLESARRHPCRDPVTTLRSLVVPCSSGRCGHTYYTSMLRGYCSKSKASIPSFLSISSPLQMNGQYDRQIPTRAGIAGFREDWRMAASVPADPDCGGDVPTIRDGRSSWGHSWGHNARQRDQCWVNCPAPRPTRKVPRNGLRTRSRGTSERV